MDGVVLPQGVSIQYHTQLESTNKTALYGSGEGLLVVADAQTAGRGRLGRTWQSPPGLNLYFSLLLMPRRPREQWGTLPLAVGVGVARALAELGFEPCLKWPNDVLLAGGKAAGILLESDGSRVVAGVGLNVNQRDFPRELRASSLALVSERSWPRSQVLSCVVEQVWNCYAIWSRQGPAAVLAEWRKFDILLGEFVSVRIDGEVLQARAVDVADDGQLVLEDRQGHLRRASSGDASLLR